MISKTTKSHLAVLAMSLTLMSVSSFAQGLEDESLLNADPIGTKMNNPQLDIDGSYQVPTEADRLNKQTQDLVKKTNDMVQKNVATLRNANEKKLGNQLQGMFNGEPQNQEDTVSSKAAAPSVTAILPAAEPAKLETNYKVIPYAGGSSMSGEGEVNFQSKVNAGLRAETLVLNKRLGIGLGFNYAQTDVQDLRYVTYQYAQNQAPEFKYRNMSGELYGKFYILTENVFRPYVGAGLGYNSTTLSSTNTVGLYNQSGFQGNNNFNNQNYNSSFASGAALIGTDILFTERVGLNLEFKYSRAFTSAFNSNNTGTNTNFQGYDSAYLQRLGQQMDDASIMAVNLGLVVAF
ncbi:MAG: outer membrane beta-barrel protein [Bacteriovoracaceae bacterium]